MIKILSRYRFVFIQFGLLLNIFFKFSAKKYDPESIHSDFYVLEHSDGSNGKFGLEKSALTIFEYNLVNVLVYSSAWVLKLICYYVMREARKTGNITKI